MSSTAGRITLWGVEVFVATAEEGAISAAAKRLGTSPATVSQQLTRLESAMGVGLLNRATRPVSLTSAGEIFLRRANVILNEAEQARAELASNDLSRLRRFRLGMIEDFDADVTPGLLSVMAEELRHCQFLLETGASHRLDDLLESRALDVIVAAGAKEAAPGIEHHLLLEEPFIVAAPKGAIGGGDAAAQLRKLPLIQYTTRHKMGRIIAAHLDSQNLVLTHRFELDSYHAIMAMVAEGVGWTILTPLGWLRAQRFRDQVDVMPMPFVPLSRVISLHARAGMLGDMPARMAEHIRPLLRQHVIAPALAVHPWLEPELKVL
ncbi:MAG: LysR family transcriptional regulator [Rhodobacteraceae bacterium]|nr:LysR family transcriptional regulator [Paracoccaceae bacterium]